MSQNNSEKRSSIIQNKNDKRTDLYCNFTRRTMNLRL